MRMLKSLATILALAVSPAQSQTPILRQKAPDFEAEAVLSDGSFQKITLSSYLNKRYVLLFFYPSDFTYICPSELLSLEQNYEQLKALNVEVLAISVDSVHVHARWRQTAINDGGIGAIRFPLVSDATHAISKSFGVLSDQGKSFRGVFVIDKLKNPNGLFSRFSEQIVRSITINDFAIGRNIHDVMRTIEALQTTETTGEKCPANWDKRSNSETMKTNPESLKEYLVKHFVPKPKEPDESQQTEKEL